MMSQASVSIRARVIHLSHGWLAFDKTVAGSRSGVWTCSGSCGATMLPKAQVR